jgi:hypothetical protein
MSDSCPILKGVIYININNDMIETMILSELCEAEKKFKPFNSGHEGWAIIKEEIDELNIEVSMINEYEKELWLDVKTDNETRKLFEVRRIYDNSIDIIKEAIQVAAMCKRFQKDLGVINVGR